VSGGKAQQQQLLLCNSCMCICFVDGLRVGYHIRQLGQWSAAQHAPRLLVGLSLLAQQLQL
jgi:hypothetical protein